jgi:hypothetical protein
VAALRPARLAMIAFALITCAWFVLGIRETHNVDRATAILSSGSRPSPARAAEAASLLRGARPLNPDSRVDILGSQLAYELGRLPQAQRIAEAVARREPENAVAWLWVARSAPNAAAFYFALHKIAALVPKIPQAP